MRVLLVGDYPPPYGGVAIHVQQLHQYLRLQGAQVEGLDIGKGGRPAPAVTSVRSPRALARELLRRRDALVHLHTSGGNPKSWAVVAGVGYTRLKRSAPRFVTLHSGLLPEYLAGSRERRAAAGMALAPYSGIICVSDAVAEAVRTCGVKSSRIHTYPAFLVSQVEPGQEPEGLSEVRQRRTTLLAYAHHPSPVYGRRAMFAALERLSHQVPGLGLAVFGPGTREEDFLADARALGVEALLEDFGELEHPQTLALISRADAFVRPTTADGDSISVRESLALGVPCVASDAAVRPAGAVTYEAGSVEGLADAIQFALSRGPLRTGGPDAGPFLVQLYRDALGEPQQLDGDGVVMAP